MCTWSKSLCNKHIEAGQIKAKLVLMMASLSLIMFQCLLYNINHSCYIRSFFIYSGLMNLIYEILYKFIILSEFNLI